MNKEFVCWEGEVEGPETASWGVALSSAAGMALVVY